MDSIVSIPKKIVEWLSKQSDMNDLKFFTEYPPLNKAVPLRKTIVAVGIEKIEIKDKFLANDDGVLERQEYCRLAEIKANLRICVPFDFGGEDCHDVFTRIADALTFRTNLNIVQSGCGEIISDRDTDALTMTGWFVMNADFCPAHSTDENFESFLDKELICGSHIRNDAVHVTPADKEKWDSLYYTGFYFGNGSSTRSITFDFEPGLVMVAAANNSIMNLNFSDAEGKSFFGIATDNLGTNGIELTQSGFKISNYTSDSVVTSLNNSGTIYMYIAFKK